MLDKLHTLYEKIYYRLFIKYHHIDTCYYKGGKIDPEKRVVVYMDYPKFIHFGDALWFEPVARLLQKYFSQLVICCNPQLRFYFTRLGYAVISRDEITSSDTLVTRTELAHHLKGKRVLWVNFNFTKIKQPLIDVVLGNLAKYLHLELDNISSRPKPVYFTDDEKHHVFQRFNLNSEHFYIILNNYVDSRKFGTTMNAIEQVYTKLLKFANEYSKTHDVKLIHVGTAQEKLRDTHDYKDVTLDLRGKTSVEDGFILASLPNIKDYIGFDTLWLHLFNLYNKNSHIVLRPGFSEIYNLQVERYVVVPYTSSYNSNVFIIR